MGIDSVARVNARCVSSFGLSRALAHTDVRRQPMDSIQFMTNNNCIDSKTEIRYSRKALHCTDGTKEPAAQPQTIYYGSSAFTVIFQKSGADEKRMGIYSEIPEGKIQERKNGETKKTAEKEAIGCGITRYVFVNEH